MITRGITLLIGAMFTAGEFNAGAAATDPPFKITTRKVDDGIQVEMDKDKTVFGIGSRSGIGDATIERLEDAWPKTAQFKVYLKGLEQFQIANGSVILDVAVSSSDGRQRISLIKEGKTSTVDAKSPYWLAVRAMGADGKPTNDRPVKNGYFEITLPRAMLDSNPKALKLKWIDFPRS